MELKSDINCCSQLILKDFGGPQMSNTSGSRIYNSDCYFSIYHEFVSQIKKAVKVYNEYNIPDDCPDLYFYRRIDHQSFVTATTVALQDKAEEYLEEFGFKRVHSSFNEKYCNVTAVSMWIMDAKEFAKKLEDKVEEDL